AGEKRVSAHEDEQRPKDMPKEKGKPDKNKVTPEGNPKPSIIQEPPIGKLKEERSAVVGTTTEQRNRIRDGLPAKLDRQSRKDEYPAGRGPLVITKTVVNARRVRFVFVARHFGTDYPPLTNWLNTTQVFYRRKLEELGLGTGTWQQTNLTWPPK